MVRQLDTGSGELELLMDIERQLDTESGEPRQEDKLESQIVIGKCQ